LVVVTPREVVVRRDESDVNDEPLPSDEDEDVLDPAVAVVRDPVVGLLEASAEHGVIGAAAALPGEAAAAMASAAMVAAMSVRRAPLNHGNMRENSFPVTGDP
jgi:hypothetical protein